MASTVSTEQIGSKQAVSMYDHDPDGTSATIVSGDGGTTLQVVSLDDYENFGVMAMSSALTGAGISKLEIIACDASNGTGNITVIKDSGAVVADAVGDYVWQECTAQEVAQLSTTAKFVGGRITVANAADEAVVAYVRTCPRFATSGLTATSIS